MLDSVLHARDLYLADNGSGRSHLLLTMKLRFHKGFKNISSQLNDMPHKKKDLSSGIVM